MRRLGAIPSRFSFFPAVAIGVMMGKVVSRLKNLRRPAQCYRERDEFAIVNGGGGCRADMEPLPTKL